MRELKFRAWNTSTGISRMDYLCGFSYYGKNAECIQCWLSKDGGFFTGMANHLKIMQFTGLLDVNGNEIYEGDILKREYDFGIGSPHVELHVVTFQQGCFGEENDEGQFLPISRFDILPEIVGNIYQNP